MANRDQVKACIIENRYWPARLVAAHLQCTEADVFRICAYNRWRRPPKDNRQGVLDFCREAAAELVHLLDRIDAISL